MKLDCPPVRTFSDGESFYTLPVIHDTATGEIVGDTFDIALYLDETYPDPKRTLIPTGYNDVAKEFNTKVDKIFTDHVMLCVQGMPFNPETAEVSKAEFARRAHMSSWEEILLTDPEKRAGILQSLQSALDGLVDSFASHRKRQMFSFDKPGGPFLDGKCVAYADLIVGAWLQFYKVTCPEFEQILSWHDGVWRELLQALEPYAQIK